MTTTEQIQDQAIDYVKQGQDVALKFVNSISESWGKALHSIAPGVGELPDPTEFIDRSFDFAAQLLAAQRGFAHSLVKAGAPAVRAAEQDAERTLYETTTGGAITVPRTVRQ